MANNERIKVSTFLKNAIAIKAWMEEGNTTQPPKASSQDNEEKRLGLALSRIRQSIINPYTQLKTEEEKEQFRQENPETNEIIEIIEDIDKNKLSKPLINARAIKAWMEENNPTHLPRIDSEDEEEKRLAIALHTIRQKIIAPYKRLKTEEEKNEYKQNRDYEEIIKIVEEISEDRQRTIRLRKEERRRMTQKKPSKSLQKIKEIKAWQKEKNITQLPNTNSQDAEERRLGWALARIRHNLIKPYKALKTEEEKEVYKQKHPEIEEIIQIVEEMDENKTKKPKTDRKPISLTRSLKNARTIKAWMEKRNTTQPPKSNSQNEEEKKLGEALYTIMRHVVKPYKAIETEEEKEEYREKHPEIEEIIQIVDEIYNNKQSKTVINARAIKAWIEENDATKSPSAYSEDKEEKSLGRSLQYIRQKLIKPFMKLETEEQRQEFKNKYPELEEVIAIFEEIERKNPQIKLMKTSKKTKITGKKRHKSLQNLDAIKAWMEENNTTRPPKSTSQDVEERRLGRALVHIRCNWTKPYKSIKTEEEKEVYKKKHPEIDEILSIVEEIDENRLTRSRAMNKMEITRQKKEKQASRHNKSTQDLGQESLDAQNNTQGKDAVEQGMNEQERAVSESKDNTQNL